MTDPAPSPPKVQSITVTRQKLESALIARLPTTNHTVFLVAMFVLVIYILEEIGGNPKLLANASYMQLVAGIVAILGVIASHLFGNKPPQGPTTPSTPQPGDAGKTQ